MSQTSIGPATEYRAIRPGEDSPAGGARQAIGADLVLAALTRTAAFIVMTMLAALVAVLAYASTPSIKAFGTQFLVSSEWNPPREGPRLDSGGNVVVDEEGNTAMEMKAGRFGALPVIYGTAMSSVLALIVAVPLSLGAALFLVRISPRVLAGPISFLIEFLAAIPSIAFGIWGLFVLAPFLANHLEPGAKSLYDRLPAAASAGLHWMFHEKIEIAGEWQDRAYALTGRDLLCGSLVLGIMVLPIVTAISRDVLKSVPRAQIEATIALGATWWQASRQMLRYSRSGLFGAVMLGLARAAGETMAVTMVIGNNNQVRASLFAPLQTMSSLLANEFREADTEIHKAALSEVALVLLVMSLIINVAARYLVVGRNARSSTAH